MFEQHWPRTTPLASSLQTVCTEHFFDDSVDTGMVNADIIFETVIN